MSVTAQPQKHYDQLGGMDYTTRPHLLPMDKWRYMLNMRSCDTVLEEVPNVVPATFVVPQSNKTLLSLANIPAGHAAYGNLIGLTEDNIYRIGLTYSRPLLIGGAALTLNSDSHYRRWGTCKHNDMLFFVNPLNQVHYTDGVEVKLLSTNAPAGRYVMVFFDHVVVGSPNLKGLKEPCWTMWSHLHDYTNWTPGTASEADHYIHTEFQREDDVLPGLTGMVLYRNVGLIFTYSAVYSMQYTGLPRVVRVDPLMTDYGSGFYYGVAKLNDSVVWIDDKHKQFFCYRGAGPEPFGEPISKYFFDTLTTDHELKQKTWVYVDHENKEVVWVYVSVDSSGAFDRAMAFNYDSKNWSVRTMRDVHCFVTGGVRAQTLFDIKESASYYTTQTCEDVVATTESFGRLWGGANTMLLREEVAGDANASVITRTEPVLESRDYIYGSLAEVKEIRDMVVNATATTTPSVKVEVSGRTLIDTTPTWTNAGTWTPSIKEQMLTFKPVVGKVLRYKFTPTKQGTSTTYGKYTKDIATFYLRVNLPTAMAVTSSVTIGGDPSLIYFVEIYVRGAFEYHRYTGGTPDGYVSYGGVPHTSDTTATVVRLSLTAPVTDIYLNRTTSVPSLYSTFTAYRTGIYVNGGATIALRMWKDSGVLYPNDSGGALPKVQEVTGYAGEFCQVDMIQSLTADVTYPVDGNVRGFIWSAFEDNILAFGATR